MEKGDCNLVGEKQILSVSEGIIVQLQGIYFILLLLENIYVQCWIRMWVVK